jgi:hypothetical protein
MLSSIVLNFHHLSQWSGLIASVTFFVLLAKYATSSEDDERRK